jgi:HEAT repeat protein
MNQILQWLQGGDLRSDGQSSDVATFVLQNPIAITDLFEGLKSSDNVIRGRTADALEKIARSNPDLLRSYMPELVRIAMEDSVAMVRWHIAMLMGHMTVYDEEIGQIAFTLLRMLHDESVFVRSWVIVSLCIVARKDEDRREEILQCISKLQSDSSVAIRSKVRNAIQILINDQQRFPKGWIKSEHLAGL